MTWCFCLTGILKADYLLLCAKVIYLELKYSKSKTGDPEQYGAPCPSVHKMFSIDYVHLLSFQQYKLRREEASPPCRPLRNNWRAQVFSDWNSDQSRDLPINSDLLYFYSFWILPVHCVHSSRGYISNNAIQYPLLCCLCEKMQSICLTSIRRSVL